MYNRTLLYWMQNTHLSLACVIHIFSCFTETWPLIYWCTSVGGCSNRSLCWVCELHTALRFTDLFCSAGDLRLKMWTIYLCLKSLNDTSEVLHTYYFLKAWNKHKKCHLLLFCTESWGTIRSPVHVTFTGFSKWHRRRQSDTDSQQTCVHNGNSIQMDSFEMDNCSKCSYLESNLFLRKSVSLKMRHLFDWPMAVFRKLGWNNHYLWLLKHIGYFTILHSL